MTAQDILKLVFGMLGSKTAGGGVRNAEVYQPPADALISVQGRFNFFRDSYRTLLSFSIILGILIIVLIGANSWIVLTANPEDRFFVAAADGRVIPLLPVDRPNATNEELFNRAGKSVLDSLTFGYLDQDFRRAELAAIFAPGLIERLQKAVVLGEDGPAQLSASSKSFTAELDNRRPAGILRQGINEQSHLYEWLIQVPVIITTKTGYNNIPQTVQPFTLQLLVQRARSVETRYGYIISAIISAQADSPAAPASATPTAQPTPPGGQTP